MVKYRGIDVLAFEIIALISNGNTETITKVEEELDNNNLVTYLSTKYKENFMVDFVNGAYDIEELNQYFADFSGYIQGNESRKFGITNENNGLLLIVGLIINGLTLPKEK
ncbi:hypothetical protein RBU49_02990 [Clostridium sp. MB40-C1]|uniref:hypothetical protein n=1 Tax=Clostridium sp. MB40-C1 TaxID=3070996 RepID=UPI0027E1769F|nr:hypothetical protein [Clostridium sp. MB40-C1]WMJ81236.1 hypothetical protein RBU49_02990 [Clostridium sp. MB40-C1]